MQKRAVLVVGTLTLAVLAAPGCKKPEESIAEKIIEAQTGGKAKVDISGGTVTVTGTGQGKEGSFQVTSGADLKLAADFPADVPIYPKAALLSQMTMGPTRQVVLKSADQATEIFAFYQKQLAGEGWSIVQEMKMPPNYTLMGRKGKRQAVIVLAQDDKQTTVSVSITEEQG